MNIPWNDERLARLSVSCCPSFGPRTLSLMVEHGVVWKDAFTFSRKRLLALGIHEPLVDSFIVWRKSFDLEKLLEQLCQDAIGVLFPEDPGFPAALLHAPDPPGMLFIRGTFHDAPAVAVVGSRRMTSYGARTATALVSEVASDGIAIASGLAFGIDATAHEAALSVGGTTWAVLGTGLDEESVYPRAHLGLAHRIIGEGGALLSEYPPQTGSRKEHFPQRNRLIAALANAVLVVEARVDSGSLITAKLALEGGKEILAVPGPLWSESAEGTNRLIAAGARICLGASDVLEALQIERPELVARARADLPTDPRDRWILERLGEPCHIDALSRESGLDPAAMAAKLSCLELKGLVANIGGQMWSRAGKPRRRLPRGRVS